MQLGAAADFAPLQELIEKRIALINRGLFRDVPKEEIRSLEASFQEERTRVQQACDEVLARCCGAGTPET